MVIEQDALKNGPPFPSFPQPGGCSMVIEQDALKNGPPFPSFPQPGGRLVLATGASPWCLAVVKQSPRGGRLKRRGAPRPSIGPFRGFLSMHNLLLPRACARGYQQSPRGLFCSRNLTSGGGRRVGWTHWFVLALLAITPVCTSALAGMPKSGVFVRFQVVEPRGALSYVRLGGYIHKVPWYLKKTVFPTRADRDATRRVPSGRFTDWFDLGAHAGKLLHGRLRRSGGVAEFPNVTAEFITDPPAERRSVVIQLATAPDANAVVRTFREQFTGSLTSFLVSPDLKRDADALETASQMTERRLRWAREATGGKRHSPKKLIVQTSFWGPQRPELNVKEAEVLHLLGFNVVGNQRAEVPERFGLRKPGHTHQVQFGPAATRQQIDAVMARHAERQRHALAPGVPFGFADEVVCRPRIGTDPNALRHFRAWLAEHRISPTDLGVKQLGKVVPLETPEAYRTRAEAASAAAARVFYHTSRFRQAAATQRVRWHTEAFHEHFASEAWTSTLVADHPYFGGTGLGMGMKPNFTWGGAPLAMDWFDLARSKAVDLAGIEDWMGLQYMYGPSSTWEGFQLMGFQAAIFRSGSRGAMPIIAWITPSDERNLRLKTASALCQGAKHFFYWTYGPTATSTENYWSDLRSEYDGIAAVTRHLATAEHVLAPGRPPKTRLAVLYSISSDLWQPFDYVHMLERRALYFSLIHDQYLLDFLCEQDIEAGRLGDYDVLYTADPCITAKAAKRIAQWVRGGGRLFATCAAGSRNEFNEPTDALAAVFGIRPAVETATQPGRYRFRGGLNGMKYVDRVQVDKAGPFRQKASFGVLGTKVTFRPAGAKVVGTFSDGSPAVVVHRFGEGETVYVGACPGLTYIKDANFVPAELKEKWPPAQRALINAVARRRGVARPVTLSHPVVEAGVYRTDRATALVLANFTYEPIRRLRVALPVSHAVRGVRSCENGTLEFESGEAAAGHKVLFTVPLGLSDVILIE